MAINALQSVLREATGKELQFTGDFHAYWDQLGIPPGQFAERMVAWKALPQNAAWIDATEDADAAGVVEELWRNGEQGAWYDPSDLSTMFQDSAGTTPVYMPGQGQPDCWIGLQLDKRFGLARGVELNASGNFTGWSTQAGWSIGGDGAVTATSVSGGTAVLRNLSLSANTFYEITVTCSSCAAGSWFVRCGFDTLSGNISSTGTYKFRMIRGSNTFVYVVGNAGLSATFTNISVRELPGNHRWQGTATSRPVLSARYNLFTNTVFSGAAIGAPGTAPTGWSSNFNTASITGMSPLGSDYAIQLTASAQRLFFAQSFSAAANTTYSLSCLVVENSGIPIEQLLGFTGMPTGATLQWFINGVQVTSAAIPLAGARAELRLVNGATAGTPAGRVGIGCATNATGVVSVAQPDVRVSNDGIGLPPYQRVVDPNTYDTVGFPLYRKPDGADDWMQTASVDFTGTDKVTLAMALRKQSDALVGIAVELSADSNANVGTFALFAPLSAGAGTIGARSKGTVASLDSSPAVYPAPATVVAVMQASIPDDLLALRFNGIAKTPVSSDQGTGTYGNHPIYFDRRGGASTTFGGRDYGTLIVGRLLSAPETAAVEKLLRQKSKAY